MSEKRKVGFFKGIKNEFKKISWPTKDELGKSAIVVFVSLIGLSLMVKLIDVVIKFVLKLVI